MKLKIGLLQFGAIAPSHNPVRRVGSGMLVLAMCGGCGGTSQSVARSSLPRLVLQQSDLPTAFIAFDVGKQVGIDNEGTVRADPGRYGRQGGWKARYHRAGTLTSSGPLVVESKADLFPSNGDAQHDIEDYKKQFQQSPGRGAHLVKVPRIGDGAIAMTFVQSPGLNATRFYVIAWSDKNVSASVTVDGFEAHTSLVDAVKLARKQERHIVAATN